MISIKEIKDVLKDLGIDGKIDWVEADNGNIVGVAIIFQSKEDRHLFSVSTNFELYTSIVLMVKE